LLVVSATVARLKPAYFNVAVRDGVRVSGVILDAADLSARVTDDLIARVARVEPAFSDRLDPDAVLLSVHLLSLVSSL
jgi:hypothetical protein